MNKKIIGLTSVALVLGGLVACKEEASTSGGLAVPAKLYTDSLFTVMNADRANYTKLIIQRLGPIQRKADQCVDKAQGRLFI